jgi:cytochrome c-type biogenesis protein CcmF
MVVHLGVVVIAVALTAATSFGHRGEVTLRPGAAATFDGHRIAYEGLRFVKTSAKRATEAEVMVDGRGIFRPALSQFGPGTDPVGTPAVDSGLFDDVYLTVDSLPASASAATAGDPVTIGVTVQPLVVWLWVGGAVMILGAILAAVPGRGRRRPTDPASAPVPAVSGVRSPDDPSARSPSSPERSTVTAGTP